MKDNFSTQANLYAAFRPHYPQQLYNFIFQHVKNFDKALDIATGNGQVAAAMAPKFKNVYATDISEKQLANAAKANNIFYKAEPAEQTSFANNSFDLITVAQAVHWFSIEKFYAEVNRILKHDGLLVIVGYGLLSINEAVDKWLDYFYKEITGPYWDAERKHLDEAYTTIPFPLQQIRAPQLSMKYQWSRQHFTGYLQTWSAVQHYIKKHNENPVSEELLRQLYAVWPEERIYEVSFPLYIKAGYKNY
ncbi:MAG TPA: methyltransferase domain-containing protein [Chitinophagaceae bacterium]|nr:methyltransferase domain-containing protein [Chitinophagaceae bacterium]